MYRKCGEQFLKPEQLDAVDEAALLALKPKPFEPRGDRSARAALEGFPAAVPRSVGVRRAAAAQR
jgi:hypothetical protein